MTAREEPGSTRGPGVRRPGPVARWARRHVVLVDAVWVVVLLVPCLVWLVALGLGSGASPQLQLVLSVALLAPLAWRRLAPEAVAGGVAALQLLQLLAGVLVVLPANVLATVCVLYTVTAYARRDRVWQGYLVLALAGCALLGVLLTTGQGVTAATAVLGATLAGYLRRIVRVRDEAAVERARRLAVERDSAVAVAAADERRRIARDLHDVVAHSLTVIVAQADGGRYAARQDPDAAARALETVAVTGRAALADLRAALGALRDGTGDGAGDGAGDGTARTAPLPGLADVPALVEQVRRSGVRVRLDVVGDPAPVTATTGLTVYRVVQESLTNVLTHAGADPAVTVRVALGAGGPGDVQVEVGDDGLGSAGGPGAAPPRGGMGVPGMRERVRALGGTLEAGPRPGGGWTVRAHVPGRAPAHGAAGVRA